MDDARLSGTPPQHRRRSNALAQRSYRNRQRERRKVLERLAVSNLLIGTQLVPVPEQQDHPRPGRPGDALYLSASEFFSCIDAYPEQERLTFFTLMTKELFGIRDVIKYGLIYLGYPVSASLYDNALSQPLSRWLRDVRLHLGGHVDFVAAVKAGISFLGKLNVSQGGHSRIHEIDNACRVSQTVSPSSVLFTRISFVSAIFANARHLGIPWCDLLSFESESPFWKRRGGGGGGGGGGLDTSIATLSLPDLAPTHEQMGMPHHATLDTIPWPSFRSKVIAAAHSDPPLIDKEDLCLDLMNDGLRCWGFTNSSSSSTPNAAPWDARNWEAAPWFLDKWAHLTEGRGGFEWRISSWWWTVHGEEETIGIGG